MIDKGVTPEAGPGTLSEVTAAYREWMSAQSSAGVHASWTGPAQMMLHRDGFRVGYVAAKQSMRVVWTVFQTWDGTEEMFLAVFRTEEEALQYTKKLQQEPGKALNEYRCLPWDLGGPK